MQEVGGSIPPSSTNSTSKSVPGRLFCCQNTASYPIFVAKDIP
jgi:hypothetical protein